MTYRLVMRRAEPAERGLLEDLQRRASLMWEDYRAALLANPAAIQLPLEQIERGQAWVAENAGSILGFSVVVTRADGDAELDALFVEPSAWRKGVGRALVEEAMRRCSFGGSAALHVVANPRAEEFYRVCGFKKTGEVRTMFGGAATMRRIVDEGGMPLSPV